MTRGFGLTVVKLGGSHALAPHLISWLKELARVAGQVIIVPGGGPFADEVRRAQITMGFDDRAAHHMALLAMEQFGAAMCGLVPALVPAASQRELHQILREGRTPVWMATKMTLDAAAEIPACWDVTSDSLAAWLAGRVGFPRVMLVKHGAPFGDPPDVKELAARGIVDRLFPNYLAAAGAEAVFVGPADHARASEWLSAPSVPRPALQAGA